MSLEQPPNEEAQKDPLKFWQTIGSALQITAERIRRLVTRGDIYNPPEGFYEAYVQWDADCRAALIKVTLSESSRKRIEKEKPASRRLILKALRSMEPHERSDFVRRITMGYEMCRLLPNPLAELIKNAALEGARKNYERRNSHNE